MPTVVIPQRFAQRRGSALAWTTANPILWSGEIGIEFGPPLKMKIGNGADHWNDLPYFGGAGGVEMQASATHIQYRNAGDVDWIDIVALDDLEGPPGPPGSAGAPGEDGREVEFQKTATHIQWRYVGDPGWTNMVALVDIKGDQGDPGPVGGPSTVTSIAANTTLSHATHAGKWIEVSNGAQIKLPATAGWTVGDFVELCQSDATAFTVVADTGAAIAPHTADLIDQSRYQGGVVVAKIIATDTWRVGGALADAP